MRQQFCETLESSLLTRALELSRIYDVEWKSGHPTAASKVYSISMTLRTVLMLFTAKLTVVLPSLMFVHSFILTNALPQLKCTIGQS
jgi:hypothetical protein